MFNLSFKSFITENIPSVSYAWSLLPIVFRLIFYSVLAWCLGKFSQSCFHTGRGGCIVWMHHQSHYHYFFPRWQQVELMSPFIIIINIFLCGHMNGTMGILHKYGKYGRVWFMSLRTFKLEAVTYAMLNHVMWWPFVDAPMPYFHSISVFKMAQSTPAKICKNN